jgi:hypothetical protein
VKNGYSKISKKKVMKNMDENIIFLLLFMLFTVLTILSAIIVLVYALRIITMKNEVYQFSSKLEIRIINNYLKQKRYKLIKKKNDDSYLWMKKRIAFPVFVKICRKSESTIIKSWWTYRYYNLSSTVEKKYSPFSLLFTWDQLILRRDVRRIIKMSKKEE